MDSENSDFRQKYILHPGDTITSGNTVYTITDDFVAYGGSAVVYSAVSADSSRKNPIKHIIKEVFPNEDLFERKSGIIRPRDPENAGKLKYHYEHITVEHDLGGLCYNGTNLAVPIRHVIYPDKITVAETEYTEDTQDGVFAVLDDISEKALSFSKMLEHISQPKNTEFPLRNGGCPTLHTTACLIEQVLLTLRSIHSKGVLFGDIHMNNVWLTKDGLELGIIHTSCFMDFGCSRPLIDGKKTDIIGGKIFSSKGFTPPELLSTRWKQGDGTISIQADIFSVGCLMLRCLFPTEYWDHFGESPSIGPRTLRHGDAKRLGIDESLRRKVNAILAKAMHPDPEERYPSADAMLEAIQELKRDTKPPEYLLPKAPGSSESFIEGSRTAEVDNVIRSLAINKPTFLWGCGGIGKSEISIKVAEKFEKCSPKGAYFVHYTVPSNKDQEAMEETVLRMPFSGYKYKPEQGMSLEEQRKAEYKARIHILREHYAGALLVIDNFDWAGKTWEDLTTEKSYLEMETIGLNLLFTTRNEVPLTDEVKELSREDLLKLMRRWVTDPQITDQQLYDLIEAVGGHTLTVDLIAKCISRSRHKVTPEMMLECLQNHKLSELKYPVTHRALAKGEAPARIGHRDPKTAQIYEHLKALFDLSGLDEQMETNLCYATLLPEDGMDCQLFESCLEEGQEQAFEYLLYCGWFRNSNDNVLSIHPIIREVCRGELRQNLKSCTQFLNALVVNSISIFDDRQKFQLSKVFEEAVKFAERLFIGDSEEEKVTAVEFCTIAANQGNRDAQYRLGLAWERGEGVPWPDDGKALAWFRKAAKLGHPRAKYKYACCLHWGIGAPSQDEEYEIDSLIYESACYAEDPDAAFMMAYYNYSYWWQNSEFAADWYRMAAEKGNGKAQYQLAKSIICNKQRNQITNFVDAQEEALSWLRQASGNGITAASYTLWQVYELGLWGMDVDHGLAKYWLSEKERNQLAHQKELSAKAEWCRKFGPDNPHGKHLRGIKALGTYGKNLPRYNPVALGWFHAAAAQGHVGAKNYLEGHAYEYAIPIDELLSGKDVFSGYMKIDNPEPDFYSDMIILASADDVEKWQNAVLFSRHKY